MPLSSPIQSCKNVLKSQRRELLKDLSPTIVSAASICCTLRKETGMSSLTFRADAENLPLATSLLNIRRPFEPIFLFLALPILFPYARGLDKYLLAAVWELLITFAISVVLFLTSARASILMRPSIVNKVLQGILVAVESSLTLLEGGEYSTGQQEAPLWS